jgi:cytochrome c-type biogenesis protein CcmH
MRARTISWIALALVLGTTLVVGAQGDGKPPTDEERAARIATAIKCPTCRSESAADSDAPAAQAIRDEILRRVRAGETDRQIRSFLASRYSDDILLDPPRRGVSLLVWLLPVVAVVASACGLALAFHRWRPRRRRASAEDRALVEEALGS